MVLRKLFGGKGKEEKSEINIERYMKDLSMSEGKIVERDDITYVKSFDLTEDGKGVGMTLSELEKGNIVILNVRAMLNNKVALRNTIDELKRACDEMDGDIGRIADDKLLLLPQAMRILGRAK